MNDNNIPHSCEHINNLDVYLSGIIFDLNKLELDEIMKKQIDKKIELCVLQALKIRGINRALREENKNLKESINKQ